MWQNLRGSIAATGHLEPWPTCMDTHAQECRSPEGVGQSSSRWVSACGRLKAAGHTGVLTRAIGPPGL